MRRLAGILSAAVVVTMMASPASAATWAIVPTPNPGTTNSFGGIVSLSSTSTEIWAVGATSKSTYTGCHGRTLAARWNGSAFAEVPTTTPICATVNGVSGTSTADVWAVGSIDSARSTHIRHWDGTEWSSVAPAEIPLPPSGARRLRTTSLNGVVALTPSDALAVGKAQYADYGHRALTERWTGSSWQLLANPGTEGSELNGVDAYNSTYAWAVGTDGTGRALTMKWNGSSWTTVVAPSPEALNTLRGVSVRATADAWAVGDSIKSTTDGVSVSHTLVLRWNGTSWKQIPSPNVGNGSNSLIAVDARSANDAWAVGSWIDTTGSIPILRPLVLHWDGITWSRVAAPSAGTGDSWLTSVVAPANSTDTWASGTSAAGTLVERFH